MPDLDKLLELLKESKREHDHCDDTWYCCRACRHPDHMLADGEHLCTYLSERWDPSNDKNIKDGDCTCGASEWNAKVNDTLKEFAFIT